MEDCSVNPAGRTRSFAGPELKPGSRFQLTQLGNQRCTKAAWPNWNDHQPDTHAKHLSCSARWNEIPPEHAPHLHQADRPCRNELMAVQDASFREIEQVEWRFLSRQ